MIRLAAVLTLIATQAGAQQKPCADQELLETRLAEGFAESLQAAGLNGENLLQVFANTETGTWTITLSTAEGRSCIEAAGQNFVVFNLPPVNNDVQH